MQKIFRETKTALILEKRIDINFPAHIHEDLELVYVKSGSGEAICDGKKYLLKDNSFFLAFPNQVHQYCNCIDGDYIVLILKATDLLSYGSAFSKGIPISALWQPDNNESNIPYLLCTALNELEAEGHTPIIDAYLTAMFGKLLRFFKIDTTKQANDTVLQVLTYCFAHYKENISVDDVAKGLHLSKSSVSHIFSNNLSINFCDYMNSLRLSDAVKLLKNKEFSITEISFMSGFSTIRTFNRAFKRKYGITPTEYRNKTYRNISV